MRSHLPLLGEISQAKSSNSNRNLRIGSFMRGQKSSPCRFGYVKVGHANSPCWPKEICLVWKWRKCELCFIHLDTTKFSWNFASVTVPCHASNTLTANPTEIPLCALLFVLLPMQRVHRVTFEVSQTAVYVGSRQLDSSLGSGTETHTQTYEILHCINASTFILYEPAYRNPSLLSASFLLILITLSLVQSGLCVCVERVLTLSSVYTHT